MKTGFKKLDKVLGDINNGEVVLIASRPIVDYRIFLLQLLLNSTDKQQLHTVYYSLECCNQLLMRELIRIKADLKSFNPDKEYSLEDYLKIGKATHDIYKLMYGTYKLKLNDNINTTVNDIEQDVVWASTDMFFDVSYNLVIIDYLQYVNDHCHKEFNDYKQRNAELLKQIKQLAGNCNIPIILYTGVSRKVESKPNLNIELEDITIADIEKYADKVIAIDEDIKGKSTINVLHNKNGNTGCVNLQFTKSLYK